MLNRGSWAYKIVIDGDCGAFDHVLQSLSDSSHECQFQVDLSTCNRHEYMQWFQIRKSYNCMYTTGY